MLTVSCKTFLPTASIICGTKIEPRDKNHTDTHEKSVGSYKPSLWDANLIFDKWNQYGRNIQTGLADRIG
jgi:hypothetical protein